MEEDLSATGAYYDAGGGEGNLQINIEKTSQGILASPAALPGNYRITITLGAQAVVGYLGAVVAGTVQPVIAAKATFDATRRMWCWTNGFDSLHFCVKDRAGDIRTWDGASWATGTVAESVGDFTQTDDYRLVIEMRPDHRGRFTLYDDDDAVVEQTDWVGVYGANTGEQQWFVSGYPYTDEPFAAGYGFDGQQVEPCFYKVTGDQATIAINNLVTFNCGGAAKNATIDFVNTLNIFGDFDIRLNTNIVTLDTGAGDTRWLNLYLFAIDDDTDRLRFQVFRNSTNQYYRQQVWINGANVQQNYVTDTLATSILRIVRSGTSVSFYYWKSSAWVQIGTTYTSWVSSNVYAQIYFASNAAANVFEVDNLQVYAGTIYLLNRSMKFTRVSGYEIELGCPEIRLINQIGFEEKDFPTAWGGDTVEIVNAIRTQVGWDFDLSNRIGKDFIDFDWSVVNTIGEFAAAAPPEVKVYLDCAELRPGRQYTRIEISEDIDRTPNQITIDVADEALYLVKQLYLRSDSSFLTPRIEVYVDGALYDSYFWEELRMSEDPDSTTWQIWGRNQAARLFMPYAEKITEVVATTTRLALMRRIAGDCGLTLEIENYLAADFTIPGGLLVIEGEYPMSVLQTLAGADGAVVRSARGLDLSVRYREWVIE